MMRIQRTYRIKQLVACPPIVVLAWLLTLPANSFGQPTKAPASELVPANFVDVTAQSGVSFVPEVSD
jgi:hypothetical protein